MKFLRNKFFITIVVGIFSLFSLQSYFISNSYKRDTNSYVTLIQWDGTLTTSSGKKVLLLNSKEKIVDGNVINTLNNSLAVVEWWDKSITRLWSNSKIMVKENFVADDLSKINISFELLKWKTWSNIVSILNKDSHFTQEINGTTAAVRGTVFEANYDQDYLVVHKHEVKMTSASGETFTISPGQTFSLSEFSLWSIALKIDEAFTKINQELDKEYIQKLREDFIAHMKTNNLISFLVDNFNTEHKVYQMLLSKENTQVINDYIAGLNPEKKQEIIDTLVTLNQRLTFENGEDPELYKLKVNTRWVLIDNSQDKAYNETLVRYSVYDLSDILSLEKFSSEIYNNTTELLNNHTAYLESLKSSASQVKWSMIHSLLGGESFDFSPENVKSRIIDIDSKWKEVLQKGTGNILDGFKK